ncbi:MAG: enoyl-CoA hydratase-related protein [Sphingomonadaceae bacterium]
MTANTITLADLIGNEREPLLTRTLEKTRLIIFNRPDARNALTRDMRRNLARQLSLADADDSVDCIILTGAHGVFTAGSDIRESRANPGPLVRPHPGEALRATGKPLLALVDGPCVTGGLEIALSCTLVIASDRARFADTHAKIGIFPAWGQTALLPRAIGSRRARQMMLTGEFIDATTARDWGITNEVIPSADLLARGLEIARAISACDARSVRWLSDIWRDQDGLGLEQALVLEEAAVSRWRANLPRYADHPDNQE